MKSINISYSVGNEPNELEEDVRVPNDFVKWTEEKQDEYLNSNKVINQISGYTSRMDNEDFENDDEHIIHNVMYISASYKKRQGSKNE